MKKLIVISGILLTSVGLFSGCKDYLESTLYGESTSEQFWRNGDDVVAAVNAIYQPLLEENYVHTEMTFDICSDDMWRAGDHGEDQAIEEFTYDADNPQLRYSWPYKYEIISRANAVLINVDNVEMGESLRNRSKGEAYFLRGYALWRLYLIYGEVPVFTEEDVLSGNLNKPKSSLAEVEAQIESDWLNAAELLPASYIGDDANTGRASKGTAYGFLTKLYVYTEKFDDAIEAGANVIGNTDYELAESFGDNFQVASENNPEVLFTIQYNGSWTGDNSPAIYTTPRAWGGWDFQEPVQDLVDEFEADDPRLDYSILKPGDMIERGSLGQVEYTADLSTSGYHFRKYANYNENGDLDDRLNAPLLRSADVYLLVAEAKIRSGVNGDAELNAVRERADLDPITNATMKDIIHERRVELSGENERHQDLMRWDKADIVDIVALYQQDRGPQKPPRTFQRPKHYYFPLPQREIDLSNGVLIQNSNY